MNEVFLYILIVVTWHPDNSEKIEIERMPGVYFDLSQCEKTGDIIIKNQNEIVDTAKGTQLMYRCIESATSVETEEAFSALSPDRQQQIEQNGIKRFLGEEQKRERETAPVMPKGSGKLESCKKNCEFKK
jgi:hypothetical protein